MSIDFLVTGGSGFLGINLIRHLLARGHRVRSLDIEPFPFSQTGPVDAIMGDIRDPDVAKTAVEGVGTVLHCAAALPLYTPDQIRSVDVDGTRVLLDAARRAGTRRFVFISSTAVYGVPDHHPLLEDDPVSGVGPYGKAKIEAEELCEDFRQEGLCLPILRPKSFVGPERLGIFELLYDFAREGRNFPIIGRGANRYQLLDVEDLCDAIYLCATLEDDRVNDVFNVGAAEFTTLREDFQAVLDRAGHGKHIVALPAGPAILTLKLLEALRLSPVYAWIYDTVARDSYVSIEKIETRLGFAPRYSNKDALIRNYDWYVANRDRLNAAPGVSHRVPWKRGALELAKHLF
ncbi:MAG: NAD-dependent epimerase/dehydratase family protein [Rhodobacteraceae bacterium]|nr:NAD-dependent epimerase/dehydratase family protein [Paracoccaceae bacterium]NNK65740.1 NAD-dependent epimerase/dehydratase family protein [Paracoccaceae bacterium]